MAVQENILFTDESKFEMFDVKKPQKIWQSVNKEFNDKCVAKTVKHGGGSVLVQGCMAVSGVSSLVFIEPTRQKEHSTAKCQPQCREIMLKKKQETGVFRHF